ncbi:hypothetical protein ACPSLY_16230 [Vibrio parahaemolyticus]|uniref:hypothetical protein n=1 Tax=Vibrio parahaemolyticus TaxID=670 RepID=UPI001C59C807|nr:hypothetical protein [Vibrio parahaemolyticus]MCZ6372443.1 hypothetical protein [Vibrio parahaemolyticus]MDF4503344.1 hypothetical protein [Vibrio parahaemolyticus]MDG2809543.1 hypothetical protein [Vibrio parahaemolyticus]MDG3428169.1 hypothetical protein [Vibrio parahaemolyticus]UJW91729.1 hypothetical protein JHS83_24085 [Vibrio parahaemolyticus]
MKVVSMLVLILLTLVLLKETQLQTLEESRLKLSIEQHKLEIRYLKLQLELIDESAILTVQ